jgi:hypothetical protein
MMTRAGIEIEHGQVWSTDEMVMDFEVIGFLAPFCDVIRKSDGMRGTLEFQHSPRLYFRFVASGR